MGEKVEINKAVVQRCDQRISERMRHLAQAGVRTGAVDQDKIAFGFQRCDGGGQAMVECVFTGLQVGLIHLRKVAVHRNGEIQTFGV